MGFHQKNKGHKTGKHISKRSNISYENQQKRQSIKQVNSGKQNVGNKQTRKQQLDHLRKASKENKFNSQRKVKSAPIVVECLSLTTEVNIAQFQSSFIQFLSSNDMQQIQNDGMDAQQDIYNCNVINQVTAKFGQKSVQVTLLPPSTLDTNLLSIVTQLRCIDVLLIVAGNQTLEQGSQNVQNALKCFQVIKSFGTPHIVGLGLGNSALGQKEKIQQKTQIRDFFEYHFSKDVPIFLADDNEGKRQLLRHFIEHPIKLPLWKQQRASLLIQNADNQSNLMDQNIQTQNGYQISLEGYVRYIGLSVNSLITIPGYGDYQLDKIEILDKQRDLKQWEVTRTALPNCEQEQLVRKNMEVNMSDGDDKSQYTTNTNLTQKKILKKIPKGTSAYQASWFLDANKNDNDDGSDDDSLDDMEVNDKYNVDTNGNDDYNEEDSDQELELVQIDKKGNIIANAEALKAQNVTEQGMDMELKDDQGTIMTSKSVVDIDMGYQEMDYEDYAREVEQKKQQQKEKRKNEISLEDELEQPDEVDTPLDIPARIRFQKYRGLKSLRTSQWDSNDNQPPEYQKVFAFENFTRAKKRAVKQQNQEQNELIVPPDYYVRVYITEKYQKLAQQLIQHVQKYNSGQQFNNQGMAMTDLEQQGQLGLNGPVIAFGLMQYESRLSVLNIGLSKTKDVQEGEANHRINESDVIRNKDEMLLVSGIRTFKAQPILSEDAINSDKFKMERIMTYGRNYIASVYGPITYPPVPVLAFKETQNDPQDMGSQDQKQYKLIASGGVKSCDPNRIILKKILLSGYPFKVHKRKATVRYMFHTPEDVRWFKPLELWTKNGRRGRITEPLGTHGYMKCEFDGHLSSGDTVYLTMYKRVFPKWPVEQRFN